MDHLTRRQTAAEEQSVDGMFDSNMSNVNIYLFMFGF